MLEEKSLYSVLEKQHDRSDLTFSSSSEQQISALGERQPITLTNATTITMPFCVAWNCTNCTGKTSAWKSFHRFPKDVERRKEWVIALQREGFKPTDHARICGDHFEEACFDRTGQTVRLRENAVPTVFNFPKHLRKVTKPRKVPVDRTVVSACQPSTHDQIKIKTAEKAQPGLASRQQNTHQVGSDHAYSVLSPSKLKRRLDQVQDALETCKKKLKVSQRKNQRLRKRLMEVVQSLKNKNLTTESCVEILESVVSRVPLQHKK